MRNRSNLGLRGAFVGLSIMAAACGAEAESPIVDSTGSSSIDYALHLDQGDVQPGPIPVFRFTEVATFATTVAASGDAADVYYPVADDFWSHFKLRFPVVVLLQGGRTDKVHYSSFASEVARFGFVVIVPNHLRMFGPPPAVPLTEQEVFLDAFAHVKAEGVSSASPLYQRVDGSRLGLLGHSFGGITSLRIIEGSCISPICTTGTFTRPAELKAAALYGTHLVDVATQTAIPIDTSVVPLALVQGSLDGRSLAGYADMTYAELEAPKAIISIVGANHFGSTNTNAPAGAGVDPAPQTISQQDSIERSAAWSALFLRTHVLHDLIARWYIYHSGGSMDGSVTVTSARR